MSARRCSHCDINFPSYDKYEECLAWGEETWRVEDSFDPKYREIAQAKYDEIQASRKRAGQSATDLASLYPHPEDARVTIHERNGRQFVFHRDLIEVGYRMIEDFHIVFINGAFYELQGHGPGYRLVGEYHPDGVW